MADVDASGRPVEDPDHRGEVVVVTGMTGAGRSTAAKELEDLGFFVVDNLPPQLVADVVRLVDETRGPLQPVAVVVDVRSGSFFAGLQEVIARGSTGRRTTLLFLEASDEVLVRRQEAARRPHPLQEGGRLLDGLHRERDVLDDLRADADLVIDTTGLNVHQLTDKVARAFGTEQTTSLKATIVSFGFKYGIPVDADLVADMRFLPNPHWVPELRPLSGRDAAVAPTSWSATGAQEFLDQYVPLLQTVARGYLVEGKRFMTVAIGCTGGKHRSVAMTEEITRGSPRPAWTPGRSTETWDGSDPRRSRAAGVPPHRGARKAGDGGQARQQGGDRRQRDRQGAVGGGQPGQGGRAACRRPVLAPAGKLRAQLEQLLRRGQHLLALGAGQVAALQAGQHVADDHRRVEDRRQRGRQVGRQRREARWAARSAG